MREALDLAAQAIKLGEAPIACVIALPDGKVVGWGWNELVAKRDRTAHAEMSAFRDAAGRYPLDTEDLILVCTLEPCIMCLGAAILSGVSTVIYAMRAPADGGTDRVRAPESAESQFPEIIGNIETKRARDLFDAWLQQHPEQDSQREYIEQLLSLNKDGA